MALICGSQAVDFLRSIQGVRVQRLSEEVRQTLRTPGLGDRSVGFHMVQRLGHTAPAWLLDSLRQFIQTATEMKE